MEMPIENAQKQHPAKPAPLEQQEPQIDLMPELVLSVLC